MVKDTYLFTNLTSDPLLKNHTPNKTLKNNDIALDPCNVSWSENYYTRKERSLK